MMISKAMLELIPLHSVATSMLMPGIVRTNPSLKTGTPSIENIQADRLADPDCRKTMILLIRKSGMGNMRASSDSGKAACLSAFVPNIIQNPVIIKTSAQNTVVSGTRFDGTWDLKKIAQRAAHAITAQMICAVRPRGVLMERNIAFLCDQIRYMTRIGIRTM